MGWSSKFCLSRDTAAVEGQPAPVPGLAQLAKRLLRVQDLSSPSERNFSLEGSVITKWQTDLRPSTVNDILFLDSQL